MSQPSLELLLCLGVALTAGFLVGAERQHEHAAEFGGIRTFPLIALSGALGAAMHVGVLIAFGGGLAVLVGISHFRSTRDSDDLGLSTELAAIVTFGLGAFAVYDVGLPLMDRLLLVGAATTAVLGLLALKRRLHAFATRVSRQDVVATTKLLLLAVVVLPLLPDRATGPYGALNPRSIGLLVVLISGISFAGYVAVRIYGPRKGLGITGLLGGLASSTAVTLTFAGRAKESPQLTRACAVAIVLASSTMFPRLAAELAAVSPRLATELLPALGAAAVTGLAAGGLLFWRLSVQARADAQPDEPLEIRNPLTLTSALKFAALFTAVLLGSRLASEWFADTGVLVSAVVTGLADADAISLSVAQMQVHGATSLDVARNAVGLAAASNTVSKIAIAGALGGRRLAGLVGLSLGAALAVGGVVLLLT